MMVQAEGVGGVLKTIYSRRVADNEYDHSGVHSSVLNFDALNEAK
jgi:hypothetical protein